MKACLLTIVGLFLISAEVHALKIDSKALESGKDLFQSKDHAMTGRMPGSWIVQYEAKEFDQMQIALGKSTANQTFEKTESVEGRVTRVGYALARRSVELRRAAAVRSGAAEKGIQATVWLRWSGMRPTFPSSVRDVARRAGRLLLLRSGRRHPALRCLETHAPGRRCLRHAGDVRSERDSSGRELVCFRARGRSQRNDRRNSS